MKKKYLVRKKQLYSTEIDSLCTTAAVIDELLKFCENTDNQNHLWNMLTDLEALVSDLAQNGNQYVERVPLKGGKERV